MGRERNFWGWGWADRFPDDDTRRNIAEAVHGMLGFALSLEPVPRIEDVSVPRSHMNVPSPLLSVLTADPRERITHTYGKSYRDLVRGLRRDFSRPPDLVAHPKSDTDVLAVLDWCSRENIAVIPFGGGTSVVGGVEADVGSSFKGVVSLDMRARDRVLDVDKTSRTARIEAGATGPVLEAQLRAHNLSLRHFPQSFEHSTLGGWIATRAGGHFATLYTHIDDLLSGVRMITPGGVFETRALPASGAGPSPERWVLGSEGILGVITEATVRLHPRPRFRARANVHFNRFAEGVLAARAIAQSGLFPTNCRLLDEREAALHGVTNDNTAVLLLAFESADHGLIPWMDRALEIARSYGGRSKDDARHSEDSENTGEMPALIPPGADRSPDEAWRAAFLDAPYLQTTLVTLGLVVDTFETACTWTRFEALHNDVITSVRDAMKRTSGGGRISCRFTHVYPDGPAPYYTFIAPARRGGELQQWSEIKAAASDALMRHGATITHHHAVGRAHRPWYDRERPEPFARALRAAKTALDPAGILNPNVLLPAR